ncbi:MAG: hypothetical protein KatS3mg032_0356 [Cyclobacteriaceae bacterium]|nr:MAG: hypothetical protein KatS3mg032_0356 [Cyclobacteriaceae bacterium]
MAEILPIRAWRYNPQLAAEIEALTAPLFDVVSEKQRQALYRNSYNSIHLTVPQGTPQQAAQLLQSWKENNILIQDKLPGIYVYYQYFTLPGNPKPFCRKGFICHVRVYDWNEGIILRHENTIPGAVNDRIALLESTAFHSSPTHGLYEDPNFTLEPLMDEAMTQPLYETEDYQGVRDVLAVIHDARAIKMFMQVLRDKTLVLADGHHRYEASIAVKQKCRAASPHHTGKEGYNYHLMYLTNTKANDLCILPTHRLIKDLPGLNEQAVMKKLEEYFAIRPLEEPDTIPEIIAGKPWAFGLIFPENAYKIRLKPEALTRITWPFPKEILELDLTVLHYFILEKALGIPGKTQRSSPYVAYDRNFSDCLLKVMQGKAQLAIITNQITIEQVMQVCRSGYTMPQKSTYFYPKVISGFVFSSIRQSEFAVPPYAPFP